MPAGADRPFPPIRRAVTTAIIISMVFAVLGYGKGLTAADSLLAFLATFALELGVVCLLFRHDIAAMVRDRRDG